MPSPAQKAARALPLAGLALLLCGAGIVTEGDPTDLPISPSAGLPVTQMSRGDVMEMNTDSGMVWLPTPYLPEGSDAGPPDAGSPDAGQPGPCAALEARIAHRREFLLGLTVKAEQLGWAVAARAYCEQHPGEVECGRPNTASERDISEVTIQSPDDPPPEVDPWIIRWQKDLERCRQPQQPVKKAR